jgi:hypothetical protein
MLDTWIFMRGNASSAVRACWADPVGRSRPRSPNKEQFDQPNDGYVAARYVRP